MLSRVFSGFHEGECLRVKASVFGFLRKLRILGLMESVFEVFLTGGRGFLG